MIQASLFSQVSGVQDGSPVIHSNLSGERSHAGIQLSQSSVATVSPIGSNVARTGSQSFTAVKSVEYSATEQLPDVCRRRHGGNAQSEAANAKVAPAKKGMRVAILTALAASDGLTLKELASQFNKQLNQISGRVTELLADQLIERTSAERDGCAVLRTKGTNA